MEYYAIEPHRLVAEARMPLQILADPGEVFYELALEMLAVIEANNAAGRHTVLILPVGPTGQYPIFVRLVNGRGTKLQSCWFINMDEYLGGDGGFIPESHFLSFRGYMNREVYGKIRPELLMPESQRIFPDPADLGRIPSLLAQLGGVDACFGGIGINGHLAFNEPQPGLTTEQFARLETRVLQIAPETRATNAAGSCGGALEAMPTHAVTVGMREILGARKLRLAVFRDWHRAVLRRAVCAAPAAAFPATLAQTHPDARLYATANAAALPW